MPTQPASARMSAWGITATVPLKSEENELTKLSIVDVLDPRLSYKSATVTTDSVPTVSLVEDTDYTIDEMPPRTQSR